jgi:hypothetical protein
VREVACMQTEGMTGARRCCGRVHVWNGVCIGFEALVVVAKVLEEGELAIAEERLHVSTELARVTRDGRELVVRVGAVVVAARSRRKAKLYRFVELLRRCQVCAQLLPRLRVPVVRGLRVKERW